MLFVPKRAGHLSFQLDKTLQSRRTKLITVCGAGGGGFMMAILSQSSNRKIFDEMLKLFWTETWNKMIVSRNKHNCHSKQPVLGALSERNQSRMKQWSQRWISSSIIWFVKYWTLAEQSTMDSAGWDLVTNFVKEKYAFWKVFRRLHRYWC